VVSELNEGLAADIIELARRRGAESAEVFLWHKREFSVVVRLGQIETLREATSCGLSLRVLIGGRQASVSGSDLNPQQISSLIEDAIEMARATSADELAGLPEPEQLATSIPELELYDPAIESLSAQQKIELAMRAEAAARETSDKIINSEGSSFSSTVGLIILANSAGFAGSYRTSVCSLSVAPVASNGDRMQRDYWYDMKRKLCELESPEHIGRKAAERTIRKLGARAVPTQKVPIVFEANMAGELLSSLFQAVSGEAISRKASFLVGQLNERVAPEKLTIIDDGTMRGRLGSRPFDGEGLESRRTAVIRNGMLESYLLNTYTARKLKLESTANATPSVSGPPGIGPTNFFIEPGPHRPEEIIRSVPRGFYVTELLGFGVNIVTGDYSRSAAGLWIENGQLAFPVQGVTVAGNLKDMLKGIEMIGNDLDFRGQIASPTLLIAEMTVSA
jgi:PmbA protein